MTADQVLAELSGTLAMAKADPSPTSTMLDLRPFRSLREELARLLLIHAEALIEIAAAAWWTVNVQNADTQILRTALAKLETNEEEPL